MNTVTKKYDIHIFDHPLTIVADETEDHVRQVVAYVESVMREITNQNVSGVDVKKVAMLAALKIASHMMKTDQEFQQYETAIAQLVDLLDVTLDDQTSKQQKQV